MTSPKSRAVAASIVSPVRSISIACLRDTLRDSATIGVEQNRPILTPGVQKVAWSEAMARSQLATSWQPAAVARPSTSAITGFGCVTIDCISAEQAAMVSLEERPAAIGIGAVRRHLLEIVPGRKDLAGGGEHDDADGAVAARRLERGLQVVASRRATAHWRAGWPA